LWSAFSRKNEHAPPGAKPVKTDGDKAAPACTADRRFRARCAALMWRCRFSYRRHTGGRTMSNRAIELRLDGSPQERVPVLLVDAADEEAAHSIAAAMGGKVQVILASRSGTPYVVSVGPAIGRELSEQDWSVLAGWGMRLGPSDSSAVSVRDVASWQSARVLITTIAEDGSKRQSVHTLPGVDGAEISIGRGQENNIVLTDLAVSRIHLAIARTDGAYSVVDVRPSSGDQRRVPTSVDGTPIESQDAPTPLRDRSVVLIGNTRIAFQIPHEHITKEPDADQLPSGSNRELVTSKSQAESDGGRGDAARPEVGKKEGRDQRTGDSAGAKGGPAERSKRVDPSERTGAFNAAASFALTTDNCEGARMSRVAWVIIGGSSVLLAGLVSVVAWVLVRTS
jgi:pSer/pThr/pTyr-binding forkhead associated (FHA) protein